MTNYTINFKAEFRFPEPHELYSRYCNACDMARARELASGVCSNCTRYVEVPGHPEIGWCLTNDDFTEGDNPAEYCEDDYEARR